MEYIGVPLVALARALGPPVVLLAVGAVLILRRRPPRAGLLWAALGVHLLAAALPFLWLFLQVSTGMAGETYVALIMTLGQPGMESLAWLLVFTVVFARPEPAGRAPPDPAAEPAGGLPARPDRP